MSPQVLKPGMRTADSGWTIPRGLTFAILRVYPRYGARGAHGTVLPVRRLRYRHAAIALVFTSLWFVLGFILLWSPVPGALHIHSMMLSAWLLLFFAMLAISGLVLMLASFNGAFPAGGARRKRPAGARVPQAQARPAGQRPRTQQGG